MGKLYCTVDGKWCKFLKRGVCTYCKKNLSEVSRCPRLSEIETVRFSEILKKVTFEDVFAKITYWFNDQEKCIEGYRNVFNKLISMTPKKHNLTDLFIRVEKYIEDDNTPYLDTDGVSFDRKKYYGIEFCPWIDWVSMFITQETLDMLSNEDIVAACLWEMTFFGFNENTVEKKRDKLISTVDEIREREEKK